MFVRYLQSTGYEQVPPEQFFLTSFSWTPVTLNGTLDESSTYCGIIDSSDPYELCLAPKLDTPEGCSGLNAAEATFRDTRLLFFPPQVHVETASDAENALLLSATAAELTGAKQSPPIDTPVTAAFYMNKPNQQGWVTFDLDVFDVVGLTMAHIHAGNSTTNGPVVVKLVPTSEHWPTPITVSGGLPMFNPSLNSTSAYFTGAFDASQFVGSLANSTMDDFIKQVEESEENFYGGYC